MKPIIQSLIFSFVIHLIYIFGVLVVGYIKTRNYKPDISDRWVEVETLQSEVAFGVSSSPLYFIFTFIGLALICLLTIIFYRKIVERN
ncbi:hypothetical protein EKG37_15680 [Robertmurraya yapensis]|uniref:Menaquinol-cytochrome c reductase cytochrome b subunit n=1 Tax=Bacillus yapensis TaxID=2492960 RepID=A0A431W0Z2_9BACI|nr:hypothetical protein EKG37_15680 [Bacillus yapensis]TKS94776.1 hypothetical protein FAR12_15680 [Bacillus yapensis]